MTTLTVTLSAALQTQLDQTGVWLDYVGYSKAGGNAAVVPVTNMFTGNPATPVTGPLQIVINNLPEGPTTGAGLKIYFIVGSNSSATSDPIPGYVSGGQSAITVQSAYTNNYRFDSIEMSLTGVSSDQANLTSLVEFGLPMTLSVAATTGNSGGSLGYGLSGTQMFQQIQNIQPTNTGSTGSLVLNFNQATGLGTVSGPLTGPRFAVAPASSPQVVNPPAYGGDPFPSGTVQAFGPSNWTPYLNLLATGSPIATLAGMFNGAADANGIWHNQAFYNYSVSSLTRADGTHFLLSPVGNDLTNSQVKGYVDISLTALANNIYSTNPLFTATVYSTQADALAGTNPYTIFNPSTTAPSTGMLTSANNQWGTIFTQFFTGLSAGYLGGATGVSPNSAVTAGIDLSKNWNWDPTYAFGGGVPIFGSKSQVNSYAGYSDPYSQKFFLNSNSYGSNYSDNLMQQYSVGGPLLTVGLTQGGDVGNINLTIYGDTDPTQTGYTPPQLYSYIAAPGGRYTTPDVNTTGDSIGMSFALPASAAGGTSWVLDQTKAQISFKYLDGYSTTNSPIFDAHPLVINQAASGSLNTIWQQWQVVAPGGTINSYAGGGTNPNPYYIVVPNGTALPEGNILLLGNLPVVNNGVGWYRIDVGGTGAATESFNLYTTTTGGAFNNTPGSLAIDGNASITPQVSTAPTIPTFNINFMSGSSIDIDGSLMAMASQSTPTIGTPWFPVAGNIVGGTFTALPYGPSEHSSSNSVAFGWLGSSPGAPANPTYNGQGGLVGNGIDTNYTNKISAGNVAHITAYNGTVHTQPPPTTLPVATVNATADIDGQWLTPAVTLNGTGTYTVFMQEYRPSDPQFKNPVGNVSQPLFLTAPPSSSVSAAEHDVQVVGIPDYANLYQ